MLRVALARRDFFAAASLAIQGLQAEIVHEPCDCPNRCIGGIVRDAPRMRLRHSGRRCDGAVRYKAKRKRRRFCDVTASCYQYRWSGEGGPGAAEKRRFP